MGEEKVKRPLHRVTFRCCSHSEGPFRDGEREYMLCFLYSRITGRPSKIEPGAYCTLAERRHV